MDTQPVPQLWRYDINILDGSHQQQCLCKRVFEFPSVHPAYAGQTAMTEISLVCSVLDYVVCRRSGCLVSLLAILAYPE